MNDLIRNGLDQRARYSQGAGIYRIVPAAVARPASHAELRECLLEALRNGWSVTPRGAGTAMDGGNLGDGLVLDLTSYEGGGIAIDERLRRATVSPACTLDALRSSAEASGLRLPPDPSSAAWATLGGMASTNASGARSLRYGSVRRWLSALTIETLDGPLLLSRGKRPDPNHPVVQRFEEGVAPYLLEHRDDILARAPRVSKNSAGYGLGEFLASGDLLDLVVGSEGTLGVITQLVWQLDPIPRFRSSLRVLVNTRADLVLAMRELRKFSPATLEFLDRTFLMLIDPRLAGEDHALIPEIGGALIADFEGDQATEVEKRLIEASSSVERFVRRATVARTAEEMSALWRIRHGASPALARFDDGRRSLQVIEDGAVPWPCLAEYLDLVEAICRSEGVGVVLFGHAGDGHVHANVLPDLSDPEWRDRLLRIYQRTTDAVIGLGGTPSGEHGAGRLRAAVLEQLYGTGMSALFRSIKAAFDPAGIFNPGVIIPDGHSPLDRLKVGADAQTVSAEADAFLRDVELRTAWGESRWLLPH